MARVWDFLVFDDDREILELLVEELEEPGFLGEDVIKCTTVDNFLDARRYVETGNFDLVILDLQDEGADLNNKGDDDRLSGERVLGYLKDKQFIPVVFNTGYAEKIMHLQSHFVKVVRKGAAGELSRVVRETFETKLPELIRYIQDEQRKYLWGHVEEHWSSADELKEEGEVAYLLARRLSNSLSASSIRKFFNPEYIGGSKVHPVEYYIWPALSTRVSLGDLYSANESGIIYLVINPACDLEQGKADVVLLVKCSRIEEFSEFESIRDAISEQQVVGSGKRKELTGLIGDNRKIAGGQPDRYKYLPGTSFLPHLVADFQFLSQIPMEDFLKGESFTKIATLDTPFAEGVQAKFARYYGRFGMPDLNFESIAGDIILAMQNVRA
ncbi:hypothetical protein [Pseudomonas zeae]|uniref:Response regulatory domain-containing protein n=1 Tax=Pseudomonas zeae TaxID=2745510 RepID=A0A9E6TA58_9PSED|nr:hypothetical protein [Pseudomonas zeae]QXI10582.1 hypothetical protein HU754_022695 [Pseudomonas zeae]